MNNVRDVLHDVESKMKKTVEATRREFSTIRTGHASTAIVEGIRVDYYGTDVPLRQLAGISTPDAKLILIQPWDPKSLGEIERAILKSDVGITPTNDGKVIRLSVPPLTIERREELIKIVKKMEEDGKVSIRSARHSGIEVVDKLEKDKKIPEDEKFKGHKDIQNLTDKYGKEIDTLFKAKEKEITG
ncbi:MAG: ribosome recycling factor [Candidatus Omnitrophica bacterium]|nr:ribosome recycling factor [Candidatus Omnitrophota bacterium]MBU4488252.1 ribosome recycling factor [Candidatus Omnitrophota bacterium]MCG2704700.1 ribosome recycling factor [Candidatus Omnitrophota bacterium]